MFKLVIQDDEGKTTVVPLIRDEITIGRKEGNTIRLTERNVSRRHARILRNNGEVHIEDLGSYNGIRVNNARIAERVSLRVSDQVQIGDYKLYLKAEGLEQVDDAKTVPIERVDTNTATDVIPVAPAPTQPMAIPATPSPAAAPQLVGNPARTLVAIADTDPNGRPVASAAVVAALTATAGYGKLVVLSSNFAGKEYELTRPQMIVGRTDENDIVINHRSISRNHAKLVREPESGRYTISDLQSSNGVRVNGQDYGKVELRRGDVVDLGHVRLRFVEPGEDFVFSRDAVITDVPDAGGRKGLMVAIVLGLLVLAGVTIFFLTRGTDSDPNKKNPGSNDVVAPQPDAAQGQVTPDADRAVAVNDVPDAADRVDPPQPPDAAEKPDITNNKDLSEAKTYLADRKWQDAIDAAGRAKAAGVPGADEIIKKAGANEKAGIAKLKLEDALKAGDFMGAARELNVTKDTVYWTEAFEQYDRAADKKVRDLAAEAGARKRSDDTCVRFNQYIASLAGSYPPTIINRARGEGCRPAVKNPGDGSGSQGSATQKPPGDGSGSATVKPPKNPNCAPEKLAETKAKLETSLGRGTWAEAITLADAVLACGDGSAAPRGFMAACNNRDEKNAKRFFRMLDAGSQSRYAQICVRNGITP
jgi:pSer/pThr/pTyr-binding forkhead associated (FHA) protein